MIYIVIPAYNEEGNLATLVKGIANMAEANALQYAAIIVDDGSTDATPDIVRSLCGSFNIIPLENRPNAGLGRTMLKGLKKAAEVSADDDVIVTLDGDATHDPVYIPDMISKLEQGSDVVIASRFAPGGREMGLAFYRKFLSRGSGALLKAFFPTRGLQDYTCGYRAFRAEVIKRGFDKMGERFVQENGFSVTPEILIKLRSLGAKIDEVGFILKYDQKIGASKIKVSRTIVQYLKMIVRFKFSGL